MSGAWTASDSAGCAARMAAAIIALPLSGSELSDEDAIPYSDAIVWASVAPAREDNAEGSPAHDAEVIWQALQLAKMLELWEEEL